jgi:hypothetical protein
MGGKERDKPKKEARTLFMIGTALSDTTSIATAKTIMGSASLTSDGRSVAIVEAAASVKRLVE